MDWYLAMKKWGTRAVYEIFTLWDRESAKTKVPDREVRFGREIQLVVKFKDPCNAPIAYKQC